MNKDPPMSYLVHFQIEAMIASFAPMGVERLHHVSGLAMLVDGTLGGAALVGAWKFIESR